MQTLKNHLRGKQLYTPLKAIAVRGQRFERWWRRTQHVRRMRRFYAQFIKSGDLAFDVGANVGSRTNVFLQLGARVVAVEPQKECARHLFNAFYANPNFQLVNKALGAAEGKSEMFVSNFTETTSLNRRWVEAPKTERYANIRWETGQPVTVTTLDWLIQAYGVPKFVKLDVEGYEYEVMRGLSHPLPALSLEFICCYPESAIQSIERLRLFGPIRLNYVIGERFRWMLDKWVTADEMTAILASLPFNATFAAGDVYILPEG